MSAPPWSLLIHCVEPGGNAVVIDEPVASDHRPVPAGMTPDLGTFLVDALMDKGMLIDIDHMSIRSLNSTLDRAETRGYPLIASHGLFFELHNKFYDGEETGLHERLRTREQLERMANLGSLVAVMLKDDAQPDFLRTKQTLPYSSTTGMPTIRDDCRHSTKSWAQAYQSAVDVLGGPVAVGSDWNGGAQHLGPRFKILRVRHKFGAFHDPFDSVCRACPGGVPANTSWGCRTRR